jgi:hypothetical protein
MDFIQSTITHQATMGQSQLLERKMFNITSVLLKFYSAIKIEIQYITSKIQGSVIA